MLFLLISLLAQECGAPRTPAIASGAEPDSGEVELVQPAGKAAVGVVNPLSVSAGEWGA